MGPQFKKNPPQPPQKKRKKKRQARESRHRDQNTFFDVDLYGGIILIATPPSPRAALPPPGVGVDYRARRLQVARSTFQLCRC